MRLIERYLFRQMLGPALWALASLAAVGMLSQSLSALELIVEQRQSAWVFIKIIVLGMPQILAVILPLAIFVAALITLNRLQAEQEVVVCYAGGMSRWRVISPWMRISVYAAIFMLAANLWIQPLALRTMRAERNAAMADLAATLVREGQFTHPATGLTVYAQEVSGDGLMKNLFISQRDAKGQTLTYDAREGRLIKQDGAPVLVMRYGATHSLTQAGVLNYLAFDEYAFDLAPFMGSGAAPVAKPADRFLTELLHPKDAFGIENRDKLLAEAHSRIASPLYNIAFMALAICAVLGGTFSRLGYGRRIAILSGVALFVRVLGFGVQSAAASEPALNTLQYAVPLGAVALALGPFLLAGSFAPRRRLARRAA
jgi:lipopolysaccharide export system permease protein